MVGNETHHQFRFVDNEFMKVHELTKELRPYGGMYTIKTEGMLYECYSQ